MARSQSDMIKIGVAVVALLGAACLLAKFAGVFDGKEQEPVVSPEEQKVRDENMKEQERIEKQQVEEGVIEIGGA